MMMGCTRCKKDAIECDCLDMGDRLKNMLGTEHAAQVMEVLSMRWQAGKDLPTECKGTDPFCKSKPAWIPVLLMRAGPRVKQLTAAKTPVRQISAEMLNCPLCDSCRLRAKMETFVNSTNWATYERYFKSKGLSTPSPNRMTLTFRPIQKTGLIIAP